MLRARYNTAVNNKQPIMKLYTECKLVAVSRESFKDKETGDEIVYFVNVIKAEDGILNANSKADFTACEGETGVAGFEVSIKHAKREGEYSELKYNLRSFDVGSSINLEDEIN